MSRLQEVYLGLDVGGTNIAGALVDKEGIIVKQVKLPTRAREGQDVVVSQMCRAITLLLGHAEQNEFYVQGIGMGIPGPVSVKEGISLHSPNLFWDNVPIRDIIQQQFSLPVAMDNDVRCAAIGEKFFGAGKVAKDVICVTLGTGVGSGIFINNHLFRGFRDIAGEIGHITMNPRGPKCNCGKNGCLEAYVGAPNISRRAKEAIFNQKYSVIVEMVNGNLADITPEMVHRAALAGDELAKNIIQETAELIGLALSYMANLFNPQLIIVGGGVARSGEMLINPIRDTIKANAMREHGKILTVVPAQLGEDAGMIGAAWLLNAD
ncbi:MAG: ROK family protein [Firmicutes bacterium]|nr:ROK family protein [Bacillota bacterium]